MVFSGSMLSPWPFRRTQAGARVDYARKQSKARISAAQASALEASRSSQPLQSLAGSVPLQRMARGMAQALALAPAPRKRTGWPWGPAPGKRARIVLQLLAQGVSARIRPMASAVLLTSSIPSAIRSPWRERSSSAWRPLTGSRGIDRAEQLHQLADAAGDHAVLGLHPQLVLEEAVEATPLIRDLGALAVAAPVGGLDQPLDFGCSWHKR